MQIQVFTTSKTLNHLYLSVNFYKYTAQISRSLSSFSKFSSQHASMLGCKTDKTYVGVL